MLIAFNKVMGICAIVKADTIGMLYSVRLQKAYRCLKWLTLMVSAI